MDLAGTAAMLVVVAGGLVTWTARGHAVRRQRYALAVTLAGWWTAVAILGLRFASVDLDLVEVAALSRDELPLPLRVAGVWAGPAGSVLFWFAVVATVVALGVGARSHRLVGAVSAMAGPVVLVLAGPFDLVDQPVLAGRGLSPVLEHPMMIVHPPLLYAAQALVLAAALTRGAHARRWVAAGAAALTVSTLLGAWWAHDELGWGGWWAWDPVENTALAPLLALLASLHATSATAAQRWRQVAGVAVLAGIALTRSGLPSSVHAFSSAAETAVLFAVGAVAAVGWIAWSARNHHDAAPSGEAPSEVRPRERAGSWVVGGGAGWGLAVIGSAGLAAAVLGSREPPAAIDGRLLSRLLAPVGLAVASGLVVWGFRRSQRWWASLAHVGALVFAVGVAGSLASSSSVATVRIDEPQSVDGTTVTVTGVEVVTERADVVRLEVSAVVDGRRMTAAILDHPDLGRTRARPGRAVDLWGETELVVATVRDDLVRLELRRHPGLLYVWVGGAACAVGLAGAAAQSRRRRFSASSDSSVEPETSPSLDGAP